MLVKLFDWIVVGALWRREWWGVRDRDAVVYEFALGLVRAESVDHKVVWILAMGPLAFTFAWARQ